MLNDITTTIKAQLYERVTSPLLGSFLISWCIFNYKLLLIILSSLPAPEKIIYIELNLFSTPHDYIFKGIVYPLLAAIFLIYVYPYPAAAVYRAARNHRKALKKIQQDIEDETPLTIEDARKIRKISEKIKQESEIQLEKNTNEITSLKLFNTQLSQEIEASKNNESESKTSIHNLAAQLSDKTSELDTLKEKYYAIESKLNSLSNHPHVGRDGVYRTQNETVEILKNRPATNSRPDISTPPQLNAAQATPSIAQYIEDLKVFKEKEFNTIVINDKVLTEIIDPDGVKTLYTWGEIQPETYHKDVHEIMKKIRLHREATLNPVEH